MTTNFKRINIVVIASRHKHWKKFAKKNYHGRVSPLVRNAVEEFMFRSQNGGIFLEFRPILDRVDQVEEKIIRLEGTISRIAEQMEILCSTNQINTKRLLDAIVKILEEADHPLTIEDVKGRLLEECTIHEVRRELETLADKFVVDQIPPSGEDGKTTWRLLGCKGYDAK